MIIFCFSLYFVYYGKLIWVSIKKIVEIKEKLRENFVECFSDIIRGIIKRGYIVCGFYY